MPFAVEELIQHEDERGWVAEIYNGESELTLRNIHLGTMEPGAIRGNHVHRRTHEWIVFWGGPVELRVRSEGSRLKRVLRPPSRVKLPPGVAHGFRNASDQRLHFVAYRDRPHDPQDPDSDSVELFRP